MKGEDEVSMTSEPTLTCNHCGEKPATTRRQNTSYVKDELNYVTLCELCHKENNEYWDEQWREYYRNVT